MAQFPTAVKSFTTRNVGDVIQPGHVNDLQDEVNAIEAGIVNGTAPLSASNVTVNNLTVTGTTIGVTAGGNSTFTNVSVTGGSTSATLNVTGGSTLAHLQAGNSTIAGTLTVTTIVSTSIAVKSYVRVYPSAAFEFGSASTGTKVALNTEVADLGSEWDSTTYTFTPASSGYYLITAHGLCRNTGGNDVYGQLWVNDTMVTEVGSVNTGGVPGATPSLSAVLNLSSGAVGSVQFRMRSGSTASFSSGIVSAHLDIIRLY